MGVDKGQGVKPTPKQEQPKPPVKKKNSLGRGNVGHIKTVAVKNAVDSFMRHYGDSGIEARDRVRRLLGDDFRSLSAHQQRDWPDIIERGQTGGFLGDDGGGRRGGGGGSAPLPPPPFKIRTTTGQRLTPYWESEPDFVQGWKPRLSILGNTQAW